MDLLKGLIQQKKKDVAELKKQAGDTTWFARRDAERLAQEQARRAREEAEAKEKAKELQRLKELENFLSSKKRAAEQHENAAVQNGTPAVLAAKQRKLEVDVGGTAGVSSTVSNEASPKEDEIIPVERSEVIRRLRKRGEVATYFGETDKQRYERLCQLEIAEHDDELMEGQRNVFLQLLEEKPSRRMEHVDDDFDNDDDDDFDGEEHPGGEKSHMTKHHRSNQSLGDSGDATASGGERRDVSREARVRMWIRKVLRLWEEELAARTETEKASTAGKVITAQFRQTKKDLRPLMKKLHQRRVDPNVLDKIYDMVELCDKREYKLAHDKYIELSIGNAAWPMGVTMVGIHERAGRSKIFTSEIAHILNDETTRKYIHMFKRLISLVQRKFPTDPSRMVCLSSTHV